MLVGSEYGVGNGVVVRAHSKAAAPSGTDPRVLVAMRRLDEIDLPAPVSFIKLDIDGYEAAFMRGDAHLIARDRAVIFGEFALRWLRRRREDLGAVLAGLDYDVRSVVQMPGRRAWRPGAAVEIRPRDLEGPRRLRRNLLLCPRERQPG